MSHTPPLLSRLQDGTHVDPPMLLSQHRASISLTAFTANPHAPTHEENESEEADPPPPPTAPYPAPPRPAASTPLRSDDSHARLNRAESSSDGTTSSGVGTPTKPLDTHIDLSAPISEEETERALAELETTPSGGVPSFARANTIQRRSSQTQIQNDAAWRRAQTEMGQDQLDADDIAPYFPTANGGPRSSVIGTEPRQLRASLVHKSLLAASLEAATGKEQRDGEWDDSTINTRNASPSQSFLSQNEQAMMTQLPKEFGGAAKLIMPAYITGPISNVTLPSRLDLLGRRGYKLLGALRPRRVGNAVLGWSPVITTSWKKKEWRIHMQLFHLPFIFSKSMAKILLFLRCVFVALVIIFILDASGAVDLNSGRIWPIGIFLALIVMIQQSFYRRAPDGVMAFCRSMGVPEVEEYMFSYCWKVEPDNVRTLAKAVWKAGVGVWIDVVKLCPGDEIRPMVRTTVRRVHKVVVFLCDEYCQSPNCCIEMMEAVQHPEKVTICIIKNNIHPQIMRFLINLKPRGLRMCVGFDELMGLLDMDLQDMSDIAAFQWWRSQNISGAGVPDGLVPSNWPVARFSITGRIILPEKSVDVGPVYISGDCKVTGQALALPWLLFIALIGVGINLYDMVIDKWLHSSLLHTEIDYIFLGVIAACNCAPFIGFSYLLDRRRDCHVALRPLLASRSMGNEGIKVRVVGDETDPIYIALRQFLTVLGHLAPDLIYDDQGNVIPPADGRHEPRCVTVYIMENLARRDAMFGPRASRKSFDNRFSLFIWSGSKEAGNIIPFTDDETGQRLMRYLVLVVDWEKHGLCESLFSAIGVRVVDILHSRVDARSGSSTAIGTGRNTPAKGSAIGSQFGIASLPSSFPFRTGSFIPEKPFEAVEEESEETSIQKRNGNKYL